MKQVTSLSFAFLFLQISLIGQIPNSDFSEFTNSTPCPFDSSVLVNQFDNWLLYQTLDNTWDGPIDSSICVTIVDNQNFKIIPSYAFDYTRPLFCKSQLSAPYPILFHPNWVYILSNFMSTSEGNIFRTDADCQNGLCNGGIIQLQVPNEDNTGFNYRLYLNDVNIFGQSCFPTERFHNENRISNYVIKIGIDTSALEVDTFWVRLEDVDLREVIAVSNIFGDNSFPEDTWDGQAYQVQFNDLSNSYAYYNTLVLYGDDDYPKETQPHFHNISPIVNAPDQRDINLFIHQNQTLHFQPFTYLQGGLIEGSDTLRHHLNIIINGGEFCLDYKDFIFQQGTNFLYHSGILDLVGDQSCLQFRDNAALEVADNTTFTYGEKGAGILGMRTGSTIRLGHNSHLIINNELRLWSYHPKSDLPEDREVFMELNPGSTLEFGESASITAPFPDRGPMHLNIFMNGGVLIDDKLLPEERALIRRIYPAPTDLSDRISILPNPANDWIFVDYKAEKAINSSIQVQDIQGKVIYEESKECQLGLNRWRLSTSKLPAGIYFLSINNSAVQRFLVVH